MVKRTKWIVGQSLSLFAQMLGLHFLSHVPLASLGLSITALEVDLSAQYIQLPIYNYHRQEKPG